MSAISTFRQDVTQYLQNLRTFHVQHKSVAIVIWVVALIVGALSGKLMWWSSSLPSPIVGLLGGAVMAGMLFASLIDTEVSLLARSTPQAGYSGPTWRVFVNSVFVGELKDSTYAQIQHIVLFDSRLYLGQLMNALWVVWLLVIELCTTIPFITFWIAAAGFVFAPAELAEWIAAAQSITPAQIEAALPRVALTFGVMSFLFIMVATFLGGQFGFVNKFVERRDFLIRYWVECAADGDVLVWAEPGSGVAVPVTNGAGRAS